MNRKKLFLLLLSCSLGISSYAGDIEFSGGDWKMILKEDTKKIDIACNDATVLTGTSASVIAPGISTVPAALAAS